MFVPVEGNINNMVDLILFYIFAGLTLLAGLSVIISRNPVQAVLSLVLAFISASCVWLLLEVEFLALALIVIYVGAVMVLFLFVVMMLNINTATKRASFVPYWPMSLILGILFIIILISWVGPAHFGLSQYPAPAAENPDFSNIQALGLELFTSYLYPFELAAMLLLAAMIASIALTYRGRSLNTKNQNPADQINTNPKDRVVLINLPKNPHHSNSLKNQGE